MRTAMPPIRIIAWGNVGRRDDGAALVLAGRLAERYASRPDIVVHEYHQLGPELVGELDDCRLALFVDASVRPGERDVTLDKVAAAVSGGIDTHHCSPDVLLGLLIALGLREPEAWLIGIRGHDWEFGDTLSEPTQRAIRQAEELAVQLVEQACPCPAGT
jgi:hydrogenase maturation protease